MYQVGIAKQAIENLTFNHATHGFGRMDVKAQGYATPLYARAVSLLDHHGTELIYVMLDLGYITSAVREQLIEKIQQHTSTEFDASALIVTATHTHSGPGGLAYEAMYNLVTPGYVQQNVSAIVESAFKAIAKAQSQRQPLALAFSETEIAADIPVAWNRSIKAYNQNPEVTPLPIEQCHLAINRQMEVLRFYDDKRTYGFISWFGVHATAVSWRNNLYHYDNKGHAADEAESLLGEDSLAIFAQHTAGDVSPNWQGKGAYRKRVAKTVAQEFDYAKENGHHQVKAAFDAMHQHDFMEIHGEIDHIANFVDFRNITIAPQYCQGTTNAKTVDACHGVSFPMGTPCDGPTPPKQLRPLLTLIAKAVKYVDLKPPKNIKASSSSNTMKKLQYYQSFYAMQGAKLPMMEFGGRHKRALGVPLHRLKKVRWIDPLIGELVREYELGAIGPEPMIPVILPIQIVCIGQLAILCCPGEFTTMAGKQLVDAIYPILAQRGIKKVVINTYCNEYMGYVTTYAEYQVQLYEGGFTLFGQWTLAAFIQSFSNLAHELLKPAHTRMVTTVDPLSLIDAERLKLRSHQ